MMAGRVVLCADPETLQMPEMMGLDGEPVAEQSWLVCCDSAVACRGTVDGGAAVSEVWVVSCNDVAPINLAAVLKRDHPELTVRLAAFRQSGSLASRASRAHIDELMDQRTFTRRYCQWKEAERTKGRTGVLDAGGQHEAAHMSSSTADGATPAVGIDEMISQGEAAEGAVASEVHAGGRSATVAEGVADDAAGSRRIANDGSALPMTVTQADVIPTVETEFGMVRGRHVLATGYGGEGTATTGGQVLAVMGATGGCGKSTVAALIAAIARRHGIKTVLVDADLQFGDMHHLVGIDHPLRLDEALRTPHRITAAVQSEGGAHAGKVVPVLAPPVAIEAGERYVAAVGTVIGVLRESFDLVVVNTASQWSEVHANVLDRADAVLFLMAQRTTSLHATVRTVDLCARMGVATGPFVYAINGMRKNGLLSAMDASCALRGARVYEIPDGGLEVEELVGAGYLEEFLDAGNPMTEAVVRVASALIPSLEVPAERPERRRRTSRARRRSRRRVADGVV
jgi:MinD-like ATPase involved in chromosome partitioning or flagellar assembly